MCRVFIENTLEIFHPIRSEVKANEKITLEIIQMKLIPSREFADIRTNLSAEEN